MRVRLRRTERGMFRLVGQRGGQWGGQRSGPGQGGPADLNPVDAVDADDPVAAVAVAAGTSVRMTAHMTAHMTTGILGIIGIIGPTGEFSHDVAS